MPPAPPGTGATESKWHLFAAAPLLLLWWLPCLPALLYLLFPSYPQLQQLTDGVGISNSGVTQIVILALLGLALTGWRPRLGPGRPWLSAGLWTSLFLGWSAISSLAGPDPVQSLFFILGWVAAASVLWSAPSVVPRDPSPIWQLAVLHAPLIIVCVVSLQAAPNVVGEIRAAGPFLLPGPLATWLIMILPVVLIELFRAEGRHLPVALLSGTLGVATLALTFSRAAWLVGMAELSLLLLLEARRPLRSLARWAALGALGLGGLIVLRHSFSGVGLLMAVATLCAIPVVVVIAKGHLPRRTVARVGLLVLLTVGMTLAVRPTATIAGTAQDRLATLTTTDGSALGRVEFWRAALLLSFQHPLLGVGPGRFSEAYPQVQRHYYFFSDSAHGAFLELLAEIGLVGGGLFAVALGLCVARARPDPWRHPGQRGPLVGLLTGGLYSQVEIGYHFAILPTTAAFLLALATARGPTPPPRSLADKSTYLWAAPCVAVLLALFSLQRAYEDSKRQLQPEDSYRQAFRVSNWLPAWSDPAISALAAGLRIKAPPEELDLLVHRVLTYGRGHAVSFQLAGEVELSRQRYPQAEAYFTRALELDRFNRPGIFHGLLIAANARGDQEAANALTEQVLATYDLEQGWETAHMGHRQKLALELRPLLFDIADGMSPYRQPTRTEPIYRFLLKTGRDPRAMYGLGVALLTQGQSQEGQSLMRQAHALNPIYPQPTP